jgi:hypothetical protein
MFYPTLRYSQAITLDHTLAPADVSDGTFVLTGAMFNNDIKTAGGAYSARSDGGDLRFFTDALLNNPIQFDLVFWAQNATPANAIAEINVRIPTYSSTVDPVIYVGWGDPNLTLLPRTDTYGRNNAYRSGFKLWCTMDDDPDNAHIHDRTVNDLTGYKQAANNPLQVSNDGTMRTAQAFTNAGGALVDWGTGINTGNQFTVFSPFNFTGGAHGYQRIVSNKNVYTDATGFEINLVDGSNTQIQIEGSSGTAWNPTVFSNITTDGYENFAARFNGANADVFVSSVKTSGTSVIASVANTANHITLGDNAAHNQPQLDAHIDPCIIYVGAMSDAEIQLMQQNQKSPSTFVKTVGTTQAAIGLERSTFRGVGKGIGRGIA